MQEPMGGPVGPVSPPFTPQLSLQHLTASVTDWRANFADYKCEPSNSHELT